IAWCPSCHSHMHDFMEKGNDRHFDMTYLVDLLHANRPKLAPLLVHKVPMKVMLHRHIGFNELVPVNRMVPELLGMIPGVEVVDGGYTAPGYIGAERIAKVGIEFYERAVLPELKKRPNLRS